MGALSCFVFICQVDGFCLLQDLQGWQTILPQSQCFHHSWCLDHVKSHFFHHGWCFNHLKSNVFQQFMCDFPLRSPFLHIFAGFSQVFPWISHIFPWISLSKELPQAASARRRSCARARLRRPAPRAWCRARRPRRASSRASKDGILMEFRYFITKIYKYTNIAIENGNL